MGGKIKKFLKKQWILVWLITASLMLVTMIAFAEYGAVNNKIKRVLAPSASLGNLFTSNYLGLGSSNNRLAYFDSVDPNGKYEFPVYITITRQIQILYITGLSNIRLIFSLPILTGLYIRRQKWQQPLQVFREQNLQ